MPSYSVGKMGSAGVFECDTLEAAEQKIEELEQVDPDGVRSGSYYIDGPEGGITLFADPNKCADYIERHQLNENRTVNLYVVEIIGNQFVASTVKDCWDRGSEYFNIVYREGARRVLIGNADDKRHLTLCVSRS